MGKRSVLFPQRDVQSLLELLLQDSFFIKFAGQRYKDEAGESYEDTGSLTF